MCTWVFSSHLHIQDGCEMAILFFLVTRIPGKLLKRSSPNFVYMFPLWSSCAPGYFRLICIFKMAARWPFCFFLWLVFQENCWRDLLQIWYTGSPYGLVVHLSIFVSFAYSVWLPDGHFGFSSDTYSTTTTWGIFKLFCTQVSTIV